MMTPERLEEIRKRAEAATEGPWVLEEEDGEVFGIWSGEINSVRIVKTDSGVYPPGLPDAAFIAHARQDVPELVAEVERLQAKVSEIDAERLAALSKVETAEAKAAEMTKLFQRVTNCDPNDIWWGPCAHHREPADRCDICSELPDDGRALARMVKTQCIVCGGDSSHDGIYGCRCPDAVKQRIAEIRKGMY